MRVRGVSVRVEKLFSGLLLALPCDMLSTARSTAGRDRRGRQKRLSGTESGEGSSRADSLASEVGHAGYHDLEPPFIGRIESLREKQSYPASREKRARY